MFLILWSVDPAKVRDSEFVNVWSWFVGPFYKVENIRVLLTGVSGTLVKKLKVERKVKFCIKKNIFLLSKSRIHNFQENISFYNPLTSAPKYKYVILDGKYMRWRIICWWKILIRHIEEDVKKTIRKTIKTYLKINEFDWNMIYDKILSRIVYLDKSRLYGLWAHFRCY